MPKVFASLLSADFSNLSADIEKVKTADALHLDVMDGMLVDNITFGLPIIKSIRKTTGLFFDTHLMIEKPEKWVERFAEAGSNAISFHIEATGKPVQLLQKIKALGLKAGIAVDFPTPVEKVFFVLKEADFVIVMTAKAGFGGQPFQEPALEKIRAIRAELKKLGLSSDIAVDCGINNETGRKCIEAGATILIAGSHIFKSSDPEKAISDLKCIAKE